MCIFICVYSMYIHICTFNVHSYMYIQCIFISMFWIHSHMYIECTCISVYESSELVSCRAFALSDAHTRVYIHVKCTSVCFGYIHMCIFNVYSSECMSQVSSCPAAPRSFLSFHTNMYGSCESHVKKNMSMYTHTYVHSHICTLTHMYTHTYVHKCIYAYVDVQIKKMFLSVHAVQCGAVWCSVLQCGGVCCSVLQCVAVCCSVLQCVAVCCSVLQSSRAARVLPRPRPFYYSISMHINVHHCTSLYINQYHYTSMHINVYQCISMYINAYQCTSVYISVHQ